MHTGQKELFTQCAEMAKRLLWDYHFQHKHIKWNFLSAVHSPASLVSSIC